MCIEHNNSKYYINCEIPFMICASDNLSREIIKYKSEAFEFADEILHQDLSIAFNLINKCNLSCPYCYNQYNSDKDYSFEKISTISTIEMIKRVIDWKVDINNEVKQCRVELLGGEPFIQ